MHAGFRSFGRFCISHSRDTCLIRFSEVVAKVQGYSDSGLQATQPGKVEKGLEPSSPDAQCRAFPRSLSYLPGQQRSNEMQAPDSLWHIGGRQVILPGAEGLCREPVSTDLGPGPSSVARSSPLCKSHLLPETQLSHLYNIDRGPKYLRDFCVL